MKGVYARADREETKRRLEILRRMRRLPLSKKKEISNRVIGTALAKRKTGAILYSGGRDSTVLLDLVRRHDPGILVMHNDTTLGDPRLLAFVREHCRGMNYLETRADDPFTMWEEKGYYPILSKRGFTAYKRKYPELKVSPVQCCYQLKEKYANRHLNRLKIGVVFWGNRAGESMRRRMSFVDNGFLFQPKKYKWMQAYPLQHWEDKDIERYIKQNLPGYPQKRMGFETGCLCCGTDITFFPNNLSRLYQKDRESWENYMRAGFAKQILVAQGRTDCPEEVLQNSPESLLRV